MGGGIYYQYSIIISFAPIVLLQYMPHIYPLDYIPNSETHSYSNTRLDSIFHQIQTIIHETNQKMMDNYLKTQCRTHKTLEMVDLFHTIRRQCLEYHRIYFTMSPCYCRPLLAIVWIQTKETNGGKINQPIDRT